MDLEQKIDFELKIREGSAKLLAACNSKNFKYQFSNSTSTHNLQILEAAKSLLASNERSNVYTAELQKRKLERYENLKNQTMLPLGKVSLSEIRIPLMWRDSDYFKNKGDYRRFAVFCLVRIGTEILETSMVCPIDRTVTDITFQDSLLL